MAYTVTLYPTNCRAVATSFIVMSGRLGSAFGAFLLGIFLEHNCNGMFYTFTIGLSGMFNELLMKFTLDVTSADGEIST